MAASGTLAARTVIPAHKRVPYLPRFVKTGDLVGQPRMGESLNGVVTVGTTAASPHSGEQVFCRHLAHSYIEDRKFLDLAAQNPCDLHDYYSHGRLQALEQRHDEWQGSPPEVQQVVGNRQFGHWLADIAQEMGRANKACAEALLLSPDHAMAVRIQHKSRRGAKYVRVSCYDPNGNQPGGTGNHTPLEVNRPDELRKHSMQDFFSRLSTYFSGGEADTACVAAICPEVRLPKAHALPYLSPGGPEGAPPGYAAALAAAVSRHLPETLNALCKLLAAQGVTGSEVLPLLDNLALPLCAAAELGFPGMFKSFADALRLLGVRGAAALPALQAKEPLGHSALHLAVKSGHTAAFVDFAQALVRLEITGDAAVAALEARDAEGVPALLRAAQLKLPDAFVNFAKALQILGIAGMPAWQALLGEVENNTTPVSDLVKHNRDPRQLKDLQNAVALLREPPA